MNELNRTITDLWQLSRTALAGMTTVPSRYDRMQYVKTELQRTYSHLIEGMTNKKIWFAIEDQIN